MRRRLHGRPADVHADLARHEGHEVTQGLRARVVEADGHRVQPTGGAQLRMTGDAQAGTMSAVAIAAMPSPRPVKPSPSVVVARDADRRADEPGQQRLELAAPRGDLRAVADDLHARRCRPRSRRPSTSASVSRRKTSLCGAREARVVRCRTRAPRSPSPAAESSASQIAWLDGVAVAVARRVPARPASSRPPSQSGVGSSSKPCTSIRCRCGRGARRHVASRRRTQRSRRGAGPHGGRRS